MAKLLKTKDRERQFAICKVLIKIEAPEVKQAVGGLIERLRPGNAEEVEDEDAVAVRDKARALLVQIGKPAVAPILECLEGEYAGSKGDAGTLNGHARLAMVKALAEMGPAAGGTQTLAVLAAAQERAVPAGARGGEAGVRAGAEEGVMAPVCRRPDREGGRAPGAASRLVAGETSSA